MAPAPAPPGNANTSTSPAPPPRPGTFTLLLFAGAASYAAVEGDALSLPAPSTLGAVFRALDARFPGFLARVLVGAAVTLNLEYVDVAFPDAADVVHARGPEGDEVDGAHARSKRDDVWDEWTRSLEGWRVPVAVGDEVGVIPPVSSG